MKRLWIAIALLLALTGGVLTLFYSEGAMRWALLHAAAMVPGELSVKTMAGRFAGPITLRGVHYRAEAFELRAEEMTVDWSPLALLRATARITAWHSPHVIVTLAPGKGATTAPPEWRLPWRVELVGIRVAQLTVYRGDAHLATFEHTELDASLHGDKIDLQRLAFRANHAALSLSGTYAARAPFPLDVRTVLAWQARADLPVAARGRLQGDLQRLTVDQAFSAPFTGSLRGEVLEPLTQLRWSAVLDVRALEVARLRPDLPAWTLRGALQAHGDRATLAADGSLSAEHARHGRLTGNVRLAADATRWQLHELAVAVPGSSAQLRARGDWRPGVAQPMTLTADWRALTWPLTGPAQLASRTGHMRLRGSLSDYRLDLDGFLTATPLTEIGVDVRLDVRPGRYQARHIRLRSGAGELVASGTLTDRWNAEWRGQLPKLAGLWPDAAGTLHTTGRLRGPRAQPLIVATLEARDLRRFDARTAELSASLTLDLQDRQDSQFELRAADLQIMGLKLNRLRLQAGGRRDEHDITAALVAAESQLAVAASGSLATTGWRGRVARFTLDSKALGRWNLAAPVSLAAGRNAVQLGSLCWLHADAQLCAQGQWQRAAGWQASATARKLPLALLHWSLPDTARLTGALDAELQAATDTPGAATGRIQATLSPGALHYPGTFEPVVIEYRGAQLSAKVERERIIGDLTFDLADAGQLQAQYDFPWPAHNAPDLPLHGRLHVDIRDLRPLSLVLPALDQPRGRLVADLTLAGTGKAPQVAGEVALREAAVTVPVLGVQWRDVALSVRSTGGRHAQLSGTARSGDGALRLQGTLDYPTLAEWSARLKLEGEDFELVKTQQAWLLASPRLDVEMRTRTLRARGEVNIPRGRLVPRDLSQAVQVSADTQMVGAPEVPRSPWAVTADIRLKVGEQLRFDGFDFDGWIAGDVRIEQQPQQPATGSGELHVVSGRYDLYGQKLVVDRGALRFTGGPIDDPALDLRASRRVREVLAGIEVRGTLKAPQLTLFSEPALDQSDILSYLLLGRPAREARGGDGDLLYRGALAFGLAGGELLAQRIGRAFGIEEAHIEPGTTEGATSLVLGTYLTPQVYVSYGIGLFQPVNSLRLRYQLGRYWQIEAQSGEQHGADLLYTIER